MSNVVDDIDAGNILLLEQKNRLTLLLAEDRNQNVGASHFPLTRTLDMKNGALKHTLKPERRLSFTLFVMLGNERSGGVYELL